ncbi:MAG: ArsC family transcriptional regulator [Clostridiales bacterium]|mgnify:FL=1|jgi:arsenate reductase|nr:ArsC family transcriptional regulator [Clostridiales bacterium]
MNIQLYLYKRSFDTQKAERFFKERRIVFQVFDLKKHKLGRRELELFARKAGACALLDRENALVKSHPVMYTDDERIVLGYLLEHPEFLRTPLVRDGQRTMVGFDEKEYLAFIANQG